MAAADKEEPARTSEVERLVTVVLREIVIHVKRGDTSTTDGEQSAALIAEGHKSPQNLRKLFQESFNDTGCDGLEDGKIVKEVKTILENASNTWHQGFLGKLYAATTPIGLASELLIAAINSNAHVYNGSQTLTIAEKIVTENLAQLFGYTGEYAGGISQPGGSASNSSSIIIARNTLFPETKEGGVANRKLVMFTSQHGHYSVEKAAQTHGFGSRAVKSVPVDARGSMLPEELERMIHEAIQRGEEPFYVNCTAGTTVLGSFDPISPLAHICRRHKMWLHVDGSWGGAVAFSKHLRQGRLDGIELADSITFNPHKLLGVPLTCSFLLGKDMRQFWKAMTLPAEYLFHGDVVKDPDPREMYDLADLTPQCGRRGDALKMYLHWRYFGTERICQSVEQAFDVAAYFATQIKDGQLAKHFDLVSPLPLPNTQVCFYYLSSESNISNITKVIFENLVSRGFLIDMAPGPRGKMLRVVISVSTQKSTVDRLLREIVSIGSRI